MDILDIPSKEEGLWSGGKVIVYKWDLVHNNPKFKRENVVSNKRGSNTCSGAVHLPSNFTVSVAKTKNTILLQYFGTGSTILNHQIIIFTVQCTVRVRYNIIMMYSTLCTMWILYHTTNMLSGNVLLSGSRHSSQHFLLSSHFALYFF